MIYWDKQTQGISISLCYVGSLLYLFIGYLSDKYGRNKLQMMAGAGVMAALSLLSPIVIVQLGTYYFFALRLLAGIAKVIPFYEFIVIIGLRLMVIPYFKAFIVCPVLPVLSQWSAPQEQGNLLGVAFAGLNIGNVAIYPISGLLCSYAGWQSIFYFSGRFLRTVTDVADRFLSSSTYDCVVSGFCCLAWLFICYFMIFDTPMTHPRVSVEEKQYLQSCASFKQNAVRSLENSIDFIAYNDQ